MIGTGGPAIPWSSDRTGSQHEPARSGGHSLQQPTTVRTHPFWLSWANRPARAIGWSLALSLVVALATLMLNGTGPIGWRMVTRHTAQVALPFFLVAFLASAVARLWPGPRSRALLARRRAIGLAFATAQTVHGVAILLFARHDPSVLDPGLEVVGGALGFVLMAAMAATSTDAAQARLGRSAWHALHRTGQIVLFGIYLFTYAGRVAVDTAWWPGLTALLAALAIRLVAALQSRSLRSSTLPIE